MLVKGTGNLSVPGSEGPLYLWAGGRENAVLLRNILLHLTEGSFESLRVEPKHPSEGFCVFPTQPTAAPKLSHTVLLVINILPSWQASLWAHQQEINISKISNQHLSSSPSLACHCVFIPVILSSLSNLICISPVCSIFFIDSLSTSAAT